MSKSFILASIAAFFTAAYAHAVTVDFEGIADSGGYVHYDNAGFSSEGFNFKLSNGFVIDGDFWYAPRYASYNGTDWLMHNSYGDLVVDHGGAQFSLLSFDAGQYRHKKRSSDVIVTGTQADGTRLFQTISAKSSFQTIDFSGWNYLVELEISGNGYTNYDNFVVESTKVTNVPLPRSVVLMIMGLCSLSLMAFASRRRLAKVRTGARSPAK